MRRFLALAVLLCGSANAAVFDFTLTGSGEWVPGFYGHQACFSGPYFRGETDVFPDCAKPYQVPWTGLAHAETDGSADGSYTGAHLLSFSFTTDLISYIGHNVTWDMSSDFDPIVTITNGLPGISYAATSYSGSHLSFEGLAVQFNIHEFHVDTAMLQATLTLVPEPETWALMVAGVLLVHLVTRRSSFRSRRA